jgi:hypothetical protein
LGRTPYGALYPPRDDDIIDCGITLENAVDQIPNHLLRVLNVSSTFIELAFVNVRINDLPFRIYLHPGDFLDLGDDNRFEVIDPMYEDNDDDNNEDDNKDNDDEDEANDAERDRKGAVADESKEEEDVNNPSLSPNRRDEEEEEEEEEQSTPKTSKVDVDPNAAYAPKTSKDDDDPDSAHSPIVRGRKDSYKMMCLFQKGKDPASFLSREGVNEEVPPPSSFLSNNEEVKDDVPPSAFMPIAPVKVPRFAKRPKKRQADEINGDQMAKKASKSLQNPSDDKGMMGLVYLDADGNGKVFIPLTAGNVLGRTPVPSQPGHIDIGIGDVLSGEGIPEGLIKVDTVHSNTHIEVSLLHDSEIVSYSRHSTEDISATTKLNKSNPHVRLLAGNSIIFNHLRFQVRHSLEGGPLTDIPDRIWTPQIPINIPMVTPSKTLPRNSNKSNHKTDQEKGDPSSS